MKPSPGTMIWWRFKGQDQVYKFGYCTYMSNGLIRLGRHNGDATEGSVVDPAEIDWKDYH